VAMNGREDLMCHYHVGLIAAENVECLHRVVRATGFCESPCCFGPSILNSRGLRLSSMHCRLRASALSRSRRAVRSPSCVPPHRPRGRGDEANALGWALASSRLFPTALRAGHGLLVPETRLPSRLAARRARRAAASAPGPVDGGAPGG
jgi:hypothetical protein